MRVAALQVAARHVSQEVVLHEADRPERQPEVGADAGGGAFEARGSDAHHGEEPAADRHRPAEEGRVRSPPFPVGVRDHGHRCPARPLLVDRERASLHGLGAEQIEVVGRDRLDERAAGHAVLVDAGKRDREGAHSLERRGAFADVHVVRVGEAAVVAGALHILAVEPEDLIAVTHPGQRLQQQRVDEREDGGVGADAERQYEDRGRREPRLPRLRTDGEAHVGEQGVHGEPPARGRGPVLVLPDQTPGPAGSNLDRSSDPPRSSPGVALRVTTRRVRGGNGRCAGYSS